MKRLGTDLKAGRRDLVQGNTSVSAWSVERSKWVRPEQKSRVQPLQVSGKPLKLRRQMTLPGLDPSKF
jgi:hypothetical protein